MKYLTKADLELFLSTTEKRLQVIKENGKSMSWYKTDKNIQWKVRQLKALKKRIKLELSIYE